MRRTRVFSGQRVDWYLDASVVLFAAFLVIIVARRSWTGVAALVAYALLLLAHEAGHMIFAGLRGLVVTRVTLGGFFGLVECRDPSGRYRSTDVAFVAAGGVAIQLLVLVVALAVSFIPGIEKSPLLSEAAFVLVFVNAFVIAINLLPMRPLDGAAIWSAVRSPRGPAQSRQDRKRRSNIRLVEERPRSNRRRTTV